MVPIRKSIEERLAEHDEDIEYNRSKWVGYGYKKYRKSLLERQTEAVAMSKFSWEEVDHSSPIDHIVPAAYAIRHFTDMHGVKEALFKMRKISSDIDNLVVCTCTENLTKHSHTPEGWLPERNKGWYVRQFQFVCIKWGLPGLDETDPRFAAYFDTAAWRKIKATAKAD